jgi:hypothetical protein
MVKMVKNTTRARSEAPAGQSLEARLATVERRLAALLRVPKIAHDLHDAELREQIEQQERASELRQRAAKKAAEPARRQTFERFVKERVAFHTSLTSPPPAPWAAILEWCQDQAIPLDQRPDAGEFNRWLLELPGVSFGQNVFLNSVGRMVEGFAGLGISDDPAAEVDRLNAKAEQDQTARLRRESSMEHEQASADESLKRRIERDEGLRALGKRELSGRR